ncbi:MAG: argininosuccinate lyase [bacterium]|nr:argininosuccinate lyase [Candidatus Kapabacteria bacterium]
MSTSNHLWAGRFTASLDDAALAFSRSIDLDGKLYREDIAGSIAHAEMLGSCGVLDGDDVSAIVAGLQEIEREITDGSFAFDGTDEDVHMAIERRLTEKIGAAGGRLHTARSRNDQVALDERLYVRAAIDLIVVAIAELQYAFVDKASMHSDVVMPGYTHMQRAQPVLLAHHLLAYVAMLERDRERMLDARKRVNRSPLGAAALAGTSFPIDREAVANALGFDGIVENSLDAVSDRDYLIELASAASIAMMHLSRLGEELVLWSSVEFGFVEMADAFATGSSIMPQKKNPDMAELVRGKAGRVFGSLVNLLTMMKGLPLAYNRDMQEDKGPMFDVVDTLVSSLAVCTGMIATCAFNRERMAAEAEGGFSTATELADYLVRRGVPFRDAHAVAGNIVRGCIDRGITLADLSIDDLRQYSAAFNDDVREVLTAATSIAVKKSSGSTSPSEVDRQIATWRERFSLR